MRTARQIMTAAPVFVSSSDTVHAAVQRMADLSVGALPVCGDNRRLEGMITDRDIVVKVVAEQKDPHTVRVGELTQGGTVTIGADDDVDELLATMAEHKVRRVPVIEEHTLVGIVAQANVARSLDAPKVSDLVQNLSVDY